MKVNRKFMRKFTYVSVEGSTMGTVTIEKVTSEEIPDWHIFQFEHEEDTRKDIPGEFEGMEYVTTKRVIDYPNYGYAFLAYVEIQTAHRYIEGAWRTVEELSDGKHFVNGEFQRGSA